VTGVHASGWVVVTDDERRPLGWFDTAAGHGSVSIDTISGHGLFVPRTASLRIALNAALAHPSRRVGLLDDDGRLTGTIAASELLERPAPERSLR